MPVPSEDAPASSDPFILIIKDHQARIERLEDQGKRTIFKRMTVSASTSALALGLVLSFVSLYDAFVTKPETDRVNRITQFNQAVNSAAKIRQELTTQLAQTPNSVLQYQLMQTATPQILNNVSTARAILPEMADNDIGIPQLIVLAYESFTANDLESAKTFIDRAVNLKNVSSYLHSEAKRYEGRYFFMTGDPAKGRQSFSEAFIALGTSNGVVNARAALLGDQSAVEFISGDCENAATDLNRFIAVLSELAPQTRSQLAAIAADSLRQAQGKPCMALPATFTLLAQ